MLNTLFIIKPIGLQPATLLENVFENVLIIQKKLLCRTHVGKTLRWSPF